MPKVQLQGPGVASLTQALDSPGVPKEMRINPFADPGPFGYFPNDLPSPLAVDLEDPVIQTQFSVEGEALKAMGQAVGAGDQTGFAAFTQDIEHGAPILITDAAGRQA